MCCCRLPQIVCELRRAKFADSGRDPTPSRADALGGSVVAQLRSDFRTEVPETAFGSDMVGVCDSPSSVVSFVIGALLPASQREQERKGLSTKSTYALLGSGRELPEALGPIKAHVAHFAEGVVSVFTCPLDHARQPLLLGFRLASDLAQVIRKRVVCSGSAVDGTGTLQKLQLAPALMSLPLSPGRDEELHGRRGDSNAQRLRLGHKEVHMFRL